MGDSEQQLGFWGGDVWEWVVEHWEAELVRDPYGGGDWVVEQSEDELRDWVGETCGGESARVSERG